MKQLKEEYKRRKSEIKKRLSDFKNNYKKPDKYIFSELCFCILTPQANAVKCDEAIRILKKRGLLFKGKASLISPRLKGARFLNNKSKYIVDARRFFKKKNRFYIKKYIDENDIFKTRDWLAENIKGFGYKEASHFLRNIGFGDNLAILDSHILKNLQKYGVVDKIRKSLTRKEYIRIEDKLREFSKKINIPMDELDLLFWSRETGFIFK